MDLTVIIVAAINTFGLVAVALIVNGVRKNVQKIEVATNSMKDALVVASRKEGVHEGIALQKETQKETTK